MFTMGMFGILSGTPPNSCGVGLFMEMGTGKTLTTIATMGALYEADRCQRVLIIAPLTILPVWEGELRKFAGFRYSLTILKGPMDKKRQQLKEAPAGGLQIVITNYETMWRLKKELLAYDADLVIADEGHRLKDGRTSQSKAMHALGDKARFKMLLTGTPVTNHEIDLWSEYRFLDTEIFGASFLAFRNKYFRMTGYGLHIPTFREIMREEFTEKLHSIAYRCRKEDCLDLPEVMEIIQPVELEPEARKLYDRIEEECYAELLDSEITAANVLTKILRLSQITGGHVTDDDGTIRTVSTAKLTAAKELIENVLAGDGKLVIMAHFVAEAADLENLLTEMHVGYSVVRGGVSDRGEQVRRFQEDPECRVFVGQIQAAGEGITLTAADTMLFYSEDYSMVHFVQAMARIHRPGQTRPCKYYRFACIRTIDERIIECQREKKDLAAMLVDNIRMGQRGFTGGGE